MQRETFGRVILVGAGPGDPELITLRGWRALRGADVVVHDALVAPELLADVHPGAEVIDVGKRGHLEPRVSQLEIEALLVERALEGKTVVRLKGGDPFVFGRGGEELDACRRAGVPCEVIPGVSSALAAPAAAGIPVTDRRGSSSFAVVTGHRDPRRGKPTDLARIASSVDTLVVLMGMARLEEIAAEVALARAPGTPAAAVMWGTTKRQRSVAARLDRIALRAREVALAAPACLVIGDVVGLSRRPHGDE
jgi:uroporphyrin-III C-methyltransferase